MINNNFLIYKYKIYFISYYLLYFLKIIMISQREFNSPIYIFSKKSIG